MSLVQLSKVHSFDGEQLRYSHNSETLQCEMNFSVYLPPQAKNGKVPVLYWLSGLTCTDENFVQKAGAQRYASQLGVAIVTPDTSPRGEGVPDDPDGAWDFGLGAGFYLNASAQPWQKNYQMYDYISAELPVLIGENFPVDIQRSSIFGHSMGGHGALTIALRNPDQYRSVSAFSPIVAPTQCPWGHKAFGHYLGEEREAWNQYDSCELIRAGAARMPMLIDQGLADNFLAEQLRTELLEQACATADYPMTVNYREGYDHSYFFIASFIENHIAFHAKVLG